jgi:hypothetical protein
MIDCPFCGSKKKLWKSSRGNTFRCFGHCDNGASGGLYDIFSFYELANGKNQYFHHTICMVARDFNYISSEEADRIMGGYSKNNGIEYKKTHIRDYKEKIKEENNLLTQDTKIISDVYEAISQISPLTNRQMKYLKNIRKLDLSRIKKDYFNMPFTFGDKGIEFMNKLVEYIKEKYGYNKDDLYGIPGFFLNTETQEINFVYSKGIGMKTRNASGLISAIQIRTYDKIDESGNVTSSKEFPKYIWLTSSRKEKGAYCSSPADVIVPENLAYTSLFITEGKFKSEIISKEFKSTCLSIPGVNQWRDKIETEIDFINDNIKHINNIYICFDSDMGCNLKVYNSFKDMTSTLIDKYQNKNFEIVVWDESFGKGLDDVILSNNKDKLSKVKFEQYIKAYERFLKILQKRYDVYNLNVRYKDSLEDIAKEELSNIYQEEVLKLLNVKTLAEEASSNV